MAKLHRGNRTRQTKTYETDFALFIKQFHDRKAGIEIEALAMLERYQHQKPLYRNCLQKFLSHVHTLPKTLPLGSSLMSKPIQLSFL